MKTTCLLLVAVLLATPSASGIRASGAWYAGTAFDYVGGGFDNTIQTDALGSEDATTVKATATPTFIGADVRYDIDFQVSLGLSYDLTADKDINEDTEVELLFQIFDPSFNKLGRVEITGMDLTKFELDESGATEGYPSLRLAVKPTRPVLSANYQAPFTARLGVSLTFDAAFDGLDNDFQTVILSNAAKDEFGEAMHPSSTIGVGVTSGFAGLEGEMTKFRFFVRSGLIDSYGVGYSFSDVQGSVNGYTYPSGFSFEDKGSPASLGITYDLGYVGQTYRVYDLEYDGFDGNDDFQLGVNFAPRDNDSDGLPNDWEDANGFDKNVRNPADSDSDHDHQTEWQEFLQCTDPWNWASRLYVMQLDPLSMAGALDLQWSSAPGKTYELHHLNQVNWEWETIPGTGLIPSGGATTDFRIDDVYNKIGDTAQIRVALSVSF